MSVKRYKDTEWGATKRIVWGGITKYTVTVYWKFKDGQWVEMGDHLKIPLEIRRSLEEKA